MVRYFCRGKSAAIIRHKILPFGDDTYSIWYEKLNTSLIFKRELPTLIDTIYINGKFEKTRIKDVACHFKGQMP